MNARGCLGWAISPVSFAVTGIVFAIPFALAHLAGLREYASVLALTAPEGSDPTLATLQGGFYLFSYALFVLPAPILLLAAGLFAIGNRVFKS